MLFRSVCVVKVPLKGFLAAALPGAEGALCRRPHGVVLPVHLELLPGGERQAALAATELVAVAIGQGEVTGRGGGRVGEEGAEGLSVAVGGVRFG